MYLGNDSGTIERCIIEPTHKILEILKNNNAQGLFFVDATFLVVLKKDFHDGYVKVKEQILAILKNGNDIGLHIHPHLIDSFKIGHNRWGFKSYDNFRIHNLPKEQMNKIFSDSYNELNAICKEYMYSYQIDSFRAGGWCVQPFSYIKDDLKALGIKYDFSVLPDLKKNNLPKHYYDYRGSPKKEFWRFDNDVLCEDKYGNFVEIPMTIVKMNIFNVLKLKSQIKNKDIIGDGEGVYISSSGIINKLKKIRPFVQYPLSSDYMTLRVFKKNVVKLNQDFLVYVAHPKNFSQESFVILDYLCNSNAVIKYNKFKTLTS
jgi:hypothetical protein